MTRTFVRLPEFERQCKRLGLNEDDIIQIENVLLDNPAIGEIMRGTGGLRKLRIALSNRGKSIAFRIRKEREIDE